MTKLYEPDEELELEIVHGLLFYPEFLRHYQERKAKANIFEGREARRLEKLTGLALNYFVRYNEAPRLSALNDLFEESLKDLDKDSAELERLRMKETRRAVMEIKLRPDTLPFKLDRQLEVHRSYRILIHAQELKKFFACNLTHGKHDSCKGCAQWKDCRHLSKSEMSFPEKVWALQDAMRREVIEASGVGRSDRGDASDLFAESAERFEKRREIRAGGGDEFTFGVPTPWPKVTKTTDGWLPGEIYGVFAPKKTGKTISLLMCAAEAIRYKKNVAVFAMEDDKDTWIDKFVCQQAGLEWEDFKKGRCHPIELERFYTIQKMYEESWENGTIGEIFQYHDLIGCISIDDIRSELKRLASMGKSVDLVIVDHMHIMKRPWSRDLTRDDLRLNAIVEMSKHIAQEYDVAIVIAAQLKTSGDRKGEARGSDQLEDAFDAVWHLKVVKGTIQLITRVARNFGPFTIELDDHRNRLLLPQTVDVVSTLTGEEINIEVEDLLG